jgi:hypothetical protein
LNAVEGLWRTPYGKRKVTLIDTPGFDYSMGNDEHATFKRLATWLRRRCVAPTRSIKRPLIIIISSSYGSNVKLDGVIYMHNIWNEEVYHRSKFTSSRDLERLCGPRWPEKIILVNSHWSEMLLDDGEDREKELREGYWSVMLKKGSKMRRYESPGNQEQAREILEMLL